eukprot:TRINITY_DN10808_c0_g1_i2.p1 TRINITY_DN10808_c0_g1~~TRINITY_DN10808_c0_g1_i2.p1  ORF type:complete len:200 (+),score=31.21 TRINITY_DN10808_c0_g1_i2:72-602(+)
MAAQEEVALRHSLQAYVDSVAAVPSAPHSVRYGPAHHLVGGGVFPTTAAPRQGRARQVTQQHGMAGCASPLNPGKVFCEARLHAPGHTKHVPGQREYADAASVARVLSLQSPRGMRTEPLQRARRKYQPHLETSAREINGAISGEGAGFGEDSRVQPSSLGRYGAQAPAGRPAWRV